MRNKVQYKDCFGIELFEGTISDHVFPWHFHPQYNIVLIDKGTMTYYFHDHEIEVGENEVFVINAYQVHYNKARTSACTYKAIFLPASFFPEDPNGLPFFDKVVYKKAAIFNDLQRCARKLKLALQEAECAGLGVKMATLLLQHLDVINRKPAVDNRIVSALIHISENVDRKILVKELASICCLSPFHFQRVFKQSIGLSVNAYIHQLKIEKSKQMLYQGAKISATAFDTGYFDQSHFHRVFKKMYIVPPAKFSK